MSKVSANFSLLPALHRAQTRLCFKYEYYLAILIGQHPGQRVQPP